MMDIAADSGSTPETSASAQGCARCALGARISFQIDSELTRWRDDRQLRQLDAELVWARHRHLLQRGRSGRGARRWVTRYVHRSIGERKRERTRRTAECGRATRRRSPRVRLPRHEGQPRRNAQAETDDRPDHRPLVRRHVPDPPPHGNSARIDLYRASGRRDRAIRDSEWSCHWPIRPGTSDSPPDRLSRDPSVRWPLSETPRLRACVRRSRRN